MTGDGSSLRGRRVTLRPIEEGDTAALCAIHDEPEVARWWWTVAHEPEGWPLDVDPELERFVIEVDGTVAGLVQYWHEDDPDYRHAGIDIFVSMSHAGEGIGTEAVAVLARHLFDDHGHHRLVIDPNVGNERAIRSYEKVGFQRIGVVRKAERDPLSGEWTDALLMDLLPGELQL